MGWGCRDAPVLSSRDRLSPTLSCALLQQLHSSVRTGNLETCLRLLSLGAQANFFHPVSASSRLKVQWGWC